MKSLTTFYLLDHRSRHPHNSYSNDNGRRVALGAAPLAFASTVASTPPSRHSQRAVDQQYDSPQQQQDQTSDDNNQLNKETESISDLSLKDQGPKSLDRRTRFCLTDIRKMKSQLQPLALASSSVRMSASIQSAAAPFDVHQQQQQQLQQQQTNSNQQKNPKLYKTELCRSWVDTGRCNYGERCQYAHGEREKRPIPRHPKYKTEACQSYHKTGYCPYGPRCHFIHNEEPHVIASLVAANNAAKAAAAAVLGRPTSGGSTPDVQPRPGPGSAAGTPLRQLHSLSGTPRHVQFEASSSRMTGQFTQYNSHGSGNGSGGSQHQSLMMTQSVGGNSLIYTNSNVHHNHHHYQHRTSPYYCFDAPSPPASATAFFNDAPPPGFGSYGPAAGQDEFFEFATQRAASQQLPPITSRYQQQRIAPLSSQPQPNSQFLFSAPNRSAGDFGAEFFASSGGAERRDSSPPNSLADSGTESPELLGSSSSGSGGFSPPGTATSDGKHQLARLLPTSFHRHSSMLMMMGISGKTVGSEIDALTSASYNSQSTILDPIKDDESRNSDGERLGDDYLPTSPPYFKSSPLPLSADVDAKLIASFQNISTVEHIENFYDGRANLVGGNSTLAVGAMLPTADFIERCAAVSWSGVVCPTVTDAVGDGQRRASGSSLGSVGAAASSGSGLRTPTSTNSSAASVADDQQWSMAGASRSATVSSTGGRLPLFERFSSGSAL